jgi:hypothetical protein
LKEADVSQEIDLEKLQEQYELAGKLLGRLGGDLDEAKNRVSEIAEIRRTYTSRDTKTDEYHQRTMGMLQDAMQRCGEMYDLMLQSGTDAIRKMGQT